METTLTKHEKNIGAAIHASTFSKFFVPFGNFILPLVLWTANKKDRKFVDHNGKQALNFQISLFLYSFVIGCISIPLFIGFFPDTFNLDVFGFDYLNSFNSLNVHFDGDDFNFGTWLVPLGIAGLLHGALFVANVVYTILAILKTIEGEVFEYPLTIKFIK